MINLHYILYITITVPLYLQPKASTHKVDGWLYLVIGHLVNIGEEEEDEVGPGLSVGLREGKEVLQAWPTHWDQPFLNLSKNNK